MAKLTCSTKLVMYNISEATSPSFSLARQFFQTQISIHMTSNAIFCKVRLKPDDTRWRTGGEIKGKLANGVSSQYSHTTSERGVSSITNLVCQQSTELTPPPI